MKRHTGQLSQVHKRSQHPMIKIFAWFICRNCTKHYFLLIFQIKNFRTSLAVQRLRTCLPVQRTQDRSPVGLRFHMPGGHNRWACAPEPILCSRRSRHNGQPVQCNRRPPRRLTRGSSGTATKAQCSRKELINKQTENFIKQNQLLEKTMRQCELFRNGSCSQLCH